MPKRILVFVQPLIGDIVLAQSLFKLLKSQHSNVTIDVFTSKFFYPLLRRMPEVRRTFEMLQKPKRENFSGTKINKTIQMFFAVLGLGWNLLRLGLSLRGYYHQAIVLPYRGKLVMILLWIAQIPVRTGYSYSTGNIFRTDNFLTDSRNLDRMALPRTVDKYVYLGYSPETPPAQCGPILMPKLTVDSENADACVKRFNLGTVHPRVIDYRQPSRSAPILALVPSTRYGKDLSRIWPYKLFSKVVDYYGARGWQIWIFGSERDYQISEQVALTAKASVHNLCAKTTIVDAIDLLSRAHLCICNDTGLMHIAAAVGCPIVVVYGASASITTPPLTKHAKILEYELPCKDCRSSICRYGHYRCLTEITPTAVIEAADSLIGTA